VVPKVRQVIALEDELELFEEFVELEDLQDWAFSEDDWEAICDEQRVDTRKSYSSVLRGHER